jgi:hypothetical protein
MDSGPACRATYARLATEGHPTGHPTSFRWASQSGTAIEAGNIVRPPYAESAPAFGDPATCEWSDGRPSSSRSSLRHNRSRILFQITGQKCCRSRWKPFLFSRLRELSPLVARQLFTSTVASKIDYAASTCCSIRLETTVAAEIEQPFETI